jgi:hypothetical protein
MKKKLFFVNEKLSAILEKCLETKLLKIEFTKSKTVLFYGLVR